MEPCNKGMQHERCSISQENKNRSNRNQ